MTHPAPSPEEAADGLDETTRGMLSDRARGMSLRAIGAAYGLSPSTVAERLNRALSRHVRHPAEQLAALELDRLDRLQEGMWDRATKGDAEALNAVLKVMERRAKIAGVDDYERRSIELAERRVKLDEAKALLVVQAVTRAIARAGVDVETAEQLRAAMARELRAIEGPAKGD